MPPPAQMMLVAYTSYSAWMVCCWLTEACCLLYYCAGSFAGIWLSRTPCRRNSASTDEGRIQVGGGMSSSFSNPPRCFCGMLPKHDHA